MVFLILSGHESEGGVKLRTGVKAIVLLIGCGSLSSAGAANYSVGAGKTFTNLQSIAALLAPGDIVEVEGNAIYPGDVRLDAHGTEIHPITIRGLRINGRRPVISGVGQEEASVVRLTGNYYILENLEITGGGNPKAIRGLRQVGHGAVVREVAVYDCPRHGILNSDIAGSLTLFNVEVYRCGYETVHHQIYIGMDNIKYPGATFRMEACHVHQGKGGNNVKSRAGRNEIYYNWIEGANYCELDLIGPDRHGQPEDKSKHRRADSDVVGNVIYKSNPTPVHAIRLGGDGSGTSYGRYRFVNNTIILSPSLANNIAVFKLQDDLESVEAHNNVFYRFGQALRMFYDPGLKYQTTGNNNWIPKGSAFIPKTWKGTVAGVNPGFRDLIGFDLRPAGSSPLRNAGLLPTSSPPGYEFPQPLPAPKFQPRRIMPNGMTPVLARPERDAVDIGAFEGE
jgi:hypothetical protein